MNSFRIPSKLKRLLFTAAFAISAGQAATAAEIAPYFHSWDGPLTAARQATGLNSAILAFGISMGGCALQASLPLALPDARNFAAAGGRPLISFGGTFGYYIETACSEDEAFNLMEQTMLSSGIRRFDFDIEGLHVNDTAESARRARILARLQAKYPDLEVTLSLPGWLNGFSQQGIDVVRSSIAAGVRVDRVIVMAQSFGQSSVSSMAGSYGQAVIMTFQAGAQQMASLFPNKSTAQLYAMMGVTPMIGRNDDGGVFTLGDASTVANFVRNNGVGMLSWWSFQRDRAQPYDGFADLNAYSGVAQSDYQYFYAFRNAEGAVAGAPAPSVFAAAPAPAPAAATGACNASPWAQGQVYTAGNQVSYAGNFYQAKLWTTSVPTPNGFGYSDWSPITCAGNTAAPAAAQATGSCSATPWVQGQVYTAGNRVSYGGTVYEAKMWTTSTPTPNGFGYSDWTPTTCAGSSTPAAGTASCSASPWTQRVYFANEIVSYGGRLYIAKMWTMSSPSANIFGWSDWSAYTCP